MRIIAQTFIAIVCLGPLMWVDPASAQRTYSLTVSRHPDVAISEAKVDEILAEASKVLQKNPGHVDTRDNVACNVTFRRNGPVRTFASPTAPKIIDSPEERNAVHRENADVKVVQKINFCRGDPGEFAGCAWPPRAGRRLISMIVVRNPPAGVRGAGILWAHEFGHRTGLRHRNEHLALMTICDLRTDQVQVRRRECDCFLSGPRTCTRRDPRHLQCDQ